MLVLFLSIGAGRVRAQCGSLSAPSTTWQNGGNSFWNIDGNWTSGTPTASTNACILNGVSTVTLNTIGNANALQLASGNTLNVTAVASLTLSSGSNSFSSLANSGTINNHGTINNYILTNASGAHFTNSGTLNSAIITNTFDAHLTNYGTLNAGIFTNASGADFTNSGTMPANNNRATFITNSSKLTNNGLIVVSGGEFDSGGVLINNSGAHLTNNGTIGLSSFESGPVAVVNNSGAYLINNGTIAGGTFASLSNSGTFINNSVISLFEDSSLVNAAGASFANSGRITVDAGALVNQGTFNNKGTVNVTSQEDPGSFRNTGTFNNSGTMNLSFFFNSSDFSNSGTLNNKGTINLGDSCFGICSLTNSGTLNNRGTLNITASPGFAGILPNSSLTNSGTLNNAGGTLFNSLASTIDNTGTINNTSGGHFNNLGTLTNEGIFNNTPDAHLMDAGTFNNTGIFSNSGAVTISNTGLFTTSSDYTQTGGRTIVNGTLTATGGAIVDIEGGKLGGTGTINGDALMKGMMSPGSSGVPGTFTINGNYEQTSTGVFDEIIKGASSNGLLDVTGVLALDPGSQLEITLRGGFDPVGDSFTILDYGALAGEFSNGASFFADGFNWTLTYGPNDAVLTAVSTDPVSTPEPGTISSIAIGFLAMLGFARKRAAAL
jgi:hypothetical protein